MMRLNITERGSIALEPGLIRHTEIRLLVNRLRALFEERGCSANDLVTVGLPLADLPFPNISNVTDCQFWSRSEGENWWLGLGELERIESCAPRHLAQLSEQANAWWERMDVENVPAPVRLSVWSEKSFSRLILPTVQFSRSSQGSFVLVSMNSTLSSDWIDVLSRGLSLFLPSNSESQEPLKVETHEISTQDEWVTSAERAIEDIRDGEMDKLVLSRKLEMTCSRPLSSSRLLRSLSDRFSNCTVFATDMDGYHWIGASPEKLLDCQGGEVITEAVAGTVGCSDNEFVTRQRGEWLLHDPKTLYEHRWVVDGLKGHLQDFCEDVKSQEMPELLRLKGMQHLYMAIKGVLKQNTHSLQLAQALHPSAAVCGWPQDVAAQWLDDEEPFERGGYSGLVGWVDNDNNSALNVVLRSYRISGRNVDLYAGAGLVAESDPQAEWEETELKLGNMMDALKDA